MKEIDWSKAPEGAAHYDPVDNNWLRQVANTAHVWCGGGTGWGEKTWQYNNDLSTMRRLIARTTPWNGEDLPPVGLKVEGLIQGNGDWCELTLKYKSTDFSVFERADGEEFPLWNPQYSTFRPLRTPEQIAAEEREKAIEEMFNAIHPGDRQSAIVNGFYAAIKKHLGDIYDAGYRKQVQP